MAERTFQVTERCPCGNQAYRTAVSGERLCGLCSTKVWSVADHNIPELIRYAAQLVMELDLREVQAGSVYRDKIKEMIQLQHRKQG